jgi:hypothetical protein
MYLEIYSSLASAIICQTCSTNATAEKAKECVGNCKLTIPSCEENGGVIMVYFVTIA